MINETMLCLARRYARAFVNVFGDHLSFENGIEMQKAALLLRVRHSWLPFFEAPNMTDAQRERMVIVLQERLHVPVACERLIHLLMDHRRMALLPDVLDSAAQLFFADRGVLFFSITSAPVLSAEQLEHVRTFLARVTNKRIMYSYNVDPTLIAGVRAQSRTQLWEYSLIKKLRDAHRRVIV